MESRLRVSAPVDIIRFFGVQTMCTLVVLMPEHSGITKAKKQLQHLNE